MSYGDYLGLDKILHAQHPRSPNHNELLFIIQHQTSELWLKLMLHELHAVRRHLPAGDLPPAFKMLARVARIMDQLVHAWDVLATMTPPEYTAIRPYLGASSGFQSHQYRELEFILGNKNATVLARPRPRCRKPTPCWKRAAHALGLRRSHRTCWRAAAFTIDPARLAVDPTLPTVADESVKQAWLAVYQRPSSTGRCTNWRKSWWTWKRPSASGASATSPRSSASSASRPAPAARPA